MGCIYLARNRTNGMCYVGRTVQKFEQRRSGHERSAEKGSDYYFHRALRKYGINSFEWRVLFVCENEFLNRIEQYYIRLLRTREPDGYNLTDGGGGVIGWIPSEEWKKKPRGMLGRRHTEDAKARIRASSIGKNAGKPSAWKGRSPSLEMRVKMRKAKLGKKRSLTARRKQKETIQRRLTNGEKDEWKAVLSKALSERWKEPEFRAMMLAAREQAKKRRASGIACLI